MNNQFLAKKSILGTALAVLAGVFMTSCKDTCCQPECETVLPEAYDFTSVAPLTFRYNQGPKVVKVLAPKGTFSSAKGKMIDLGANEFTYKVQDGADWLTVDELGNVSVKSQYADKTADRKGTILVTMKGDSTKTILAEVTQTKLLLLEDNPLAYIAHMNTKADGTWSNAIPNADGSDRDDLLLEFEQSVQIAKDKKEGGKTYHMGSLWEWNAIAPQCVAPSSFYKNPNVDLKETGTPSNRFLVADPAVPATIAGEDFLFQTEHYNTGVGRISYGRYTFTSMKDPDKVINLAIRYNWQDTLGESGVVIKACVLPNADTELTDIQKEEFWTEHKDDLVERFFPGCGGVNYVKPQTGEPYFNWHNKYTGATGKYGDQYSNGYYWSGTKIRNKDRAFNIGMYEFSVTCTIFAETIPGCRNSLRLFCDTPVK